MIKSGTFSWDISVSDGDSIAVDGSGLIGWIGVRGSLSLNTAEVHAFLNGQASGSAVMELAIEESSGETTLLQVICTVASDLIDSGTLVPIDGSSALAESVANNRFVRRDVDQSPDGSTVTQIWKNLGVTLSGVNVAGAIDGANSPSSANPFATMADIGGGGGGSISWGGISGTITDQTDLITYISGQLSGLASIYIPYAGGALTSGGILTFSNGTSDSEIGGWGFGVELSSDSNQNATVEYNQIQVKNSSQTTKMTPAG